MSVTTDIPTASGHPLTSLLAWCRGVRAGHVTVVAIFAVVFLYFNYLPLWHTDLWGHVAQGRWILDNGKLPSQDPFQPLAAGVPLLDYAWLSQILFAKIYELWGAEGLQNFFSLVVIASGLLLTRTYFLSSGRLDVAILGWLLSTFVIGWSRHSIMRPEVLAVFLFVCLLYLIASLQKQCPAWTLAEKQPEQGVPWQMYLGIPLLFALWANLHGSFPCGIILLACFGLARVIEVLWYHRSFGELWKDLWVRRWMLWGQLALLALLLNPYGIDAILFSLRFSGRENLDTILEWQPLSFASFAGVCLVLSWVILGVVAWNSRRRWHVAEIVLIVVFMLLVFPRIRMLTWYPPVLLFALMRHITDMAKGWFPQREQSTVEPPPDSATDSEEESPLAALRPYRNAIMCAGILWIAFALSSPGNLLLGGQPREEELCYSRFTPLEVTEYLRQHPPQGQIYNPQVWGDWLVWAGPEDLQVMATTNIHLTPPRVWRDYLGISGGLPGWNRTLHRYAVELVIVDPETMPRLAEVIRHHDDWELVFEAESPFGGAIYRRADDAIVPSENSSPEHVSSRLTNFLR